MVYHFSFPTNIHFGCGARQALVPILREKGVRRPLLVTDKGLRDLPFIREMDTLCAMASFSTSIFSGVTGNPTKSQVVAGVMAYHGHKADSIIGIGGGSALDVAKAIALMAHHPGDLFDYEDGKPNARPFDQSIPLWVALPTTAGTGSEVGRSSVIADDNTHIKRIIFSPRLLANHVFADPELTVGLPATLTAATGMDALTHSVEAFLAKDYHPICDGIALEGARLSAKFLAKAVREPANLEARSGMLLSSMMGAIAFQKGLGLNHSCAHALSTVANLQHGLANGIMINHALKFNLPVAQDRFKRLALNMELDTPTPEGFFQWLYELKKQIQVPERLSQVGITSAQIPELSRVAFEDGCHQNNPRPCEKTDFVRIFEEAI